VFLSGGPQRAVRVTKTTVIQTQVIRASPVSDMFDFFYTRATIRRCKNQASVSSLNFTIELPGASPRLRIACTSYIMARYQVIITIEGLQYEDLIL